MKQRILTAALALIILTPIIIFGGLPFIMGVYVFAIIGLYELMRMYSHDKGIQYVLVSILFLCMWMYPGKLPFEINSNDIFLVFLIILLALTVLAKNKFNFDDAGFVMIATAYIGISFQALIDTRMAGLDYLLFILFIIWATDSGAYFVGKYFGKRKLWPEISPNKTIGGALGGILLALVTGSIFQLVSPLDYSFVSIVGITVLISVVGQIGDLVASAMKRHYQVKDSGKIFPGHGGILDRLDSLLFVLLMLKLIHFV